MPNNPSGQRPCSRVKSALHALLRVEGDEHRLDVKNLSLSGVCLITDREFPVGGSCHVSVLLEGYEPALHCELEGVIVRNGPQEVGISFSEIVGIESYEYLQNILLFNAAEPDRIVEEFQHHLGLRPRE